MPLLPARLEWFCSRKCPRQRSQAMCKYLSIYSTLYLPLLAASGAAVAHCDRKKCKTNVYAELELTVRKEAWMDCDLWL